MPIHYKHEIKCLLIALRFLVPPNFQAKMVCKTASYFLLLTVIMELLF